MSEGNGKGDGVLRITTEGRQKLALGDNPKVVEVDVVGMLEQWWAIDRSFRDAEGKVPREQALEHGAAAVQFVRDVFAQGGYTEEELAGFSETTALATLAELGRRGRELRRFFDLSSGGEPSSPGRTAVTYSE